MLRGDVDRFYRAVRRDHPQPPPGPIRHLDHIRPIADYYARLTQQERLLMLAWARKEESGIGIIPLALSAIPFFGLIVSARLQEVLSRLPIWQVFATWVLFGSLVVLGFFVHQSQKAWTALHITLLEQAIRQAEADQAQAPQEPARPGDHRPALPPEAGVH